MEPFAITLAEHVIITVTPCHPNGRDLEYLISIEGKNHGYIIPDIDDDLGLIWRSDGKIDQRLVHVLGRAIDSHCDR
jgi:hypothetical protein